jgi:hypothetical protein
MSLNNGAVNMPSQQYRGCVSAWSVQNGYKEEFSIEESLEIRDASLPGYELGSR